MLKFFLNPFTGNFDLISTVTLAAVGSSPNANAASIDSNQVLNLQPADASNPGVVSTGAQTFAGAKSFNGNIIANSAFLGALLCPDAYFTASGAKYLTIDLEDAASSADNHLRFHNITASRSWELPDLNGTFLVDSGLASGQIYVGNVSNVAVAVTPSGDVTISNAGVTAIGANKVANSQLAQMPTLTIKGNNTGSTANAIDLTISQVNTMLGNSGDVTLTAVGSSPNANGASLSGQALTLQPANTSFPGVLTAADWNTFNSKQAAGSYVTALTGDVTASGPGSAAATIQSNVVSNSKLAQMAAHTFKGNNTGSTANASDLTATQLTAELNVMVGDSGSGGTKGLVPAPAAGDATKFLKGDATYAFAQGTLRTINAQSGTTYTFVLADGSGPGQNPLVTFGSASATTVTVDTNANVAFPVGTQIDCLQVGAGKVTFAAAGGVTINSQSGNLSIGAQYVAVSLIKTATNTWYLIGNLIA